MLRTLAWRKWMASNCTSSDELESFPRRSPGDQRRVLGERLLGHIRYFGTRADALPEWRDAANIRDAEDAWKIWPQLPIIDKTTLRNHFHPDRMRQLGVTGIRNSTGGSTGEPTHFLHDREMVLRGNAAMMFARRQMQWRPNMATIILWGSERDIQKEVSRRAQFTNRLLGNYVVDGYRMSDETVERVLAVVRKEPRVAMYGFTTMLDYVARRVAARGVAIDNVNVAWNGGEMLFDSHVENFRKAFGVPILNLYGGREVGTMAYQPAENAPLSITRPWIFVEVVDEHGKPASPRTPGRIVVTSTICRGTPFLRYEVGDMAEFEAAHETEAGLTGLSVLHGRTAGVLELANGRTIQCLYWNHLFKETPEVEQFQVRAQPDGNLRILLRGTRFSPERERRVNDVIATFIGPGVTVAFEWVEAIPLTPQGKLVQVVRENGRTVTPVHSAPAARPS